MSTLASSSSSSPSSSSYMSTRPPTRHPGYYFEDGNTVLLVSNVLFRLHRSILSRNSTLFRSMLSLPQDRDSKEGTVDSEPIMLCDYSPHDFELLLDMIYTSPTATMEKSLEDWKAILDIAHRLEVEWIHERAFQEMARFPLDPVDKVVIAQRFEDKRYLVREAYVALVRRENTLTIDEAQRIGLVDSTRLAQAREMFRDHMHSMQLQNAPAHSSAGPVARGGVLRRASVAPRHAPYSIPFHGGGTSVAYAQAMQQSMQSMQQSYGPPPPQPGPSMHSIAHGLASSLAPVLASSSSMYSYPQGPPQTSSSQIYLATNLALPPPPPPPTQSQSSLALGITQPARMLMQFGYQPYDAEAQQQAIAEQCVDAIFGFGAEAQQASPISA